MDGPIEAAGPSESPLIEFMNWRIGTLKLSLPKRYKLLNLIGDGSYGSVCRAIDTHFSSGDEKRLVAIKRIDSPFEHPVDALRELREILILDHFTLYPSDNVIKLYDMLPPPSLDFEGFKDLQIALFPCMDYDLRYVYTSVPLSEQQIKWISLQIFLGIRHLHSAGILHRDLKPQNILLKQTLEVRICDFGLARKQGKYGVEDMTIYVGTRWYRSPEVLLSGSYGETMDIWAIGCIIYEIFTRKPLFPGDTGNMLEKIYAVLGTPSELFVATLPSRHAREMITRFAPCPRVSMASLLPAGTSPLAIDLLDRILRWDPEERLTVDQCLSHPFFDEFRPNPLPAPCPTIPDIIDELPDDCHALKYLAYSLVRKYHPWLPAAPSPSSSLEQMAREVVSLGGTLP